MTPVRYRIRDDYLGAPVVPHPAEYRNTLKGARATQERRFTRARAYCAQKHHPSFRCAVIIEQRPRDGGAPWQEVGRITYDPSRAAGVTA